MIESSLLRAWQGFVDSSTRPFTIPGHKRRGQALAPELGRLLAGDVPLFGGLGTIGHAVADLAAAEARTATRWGAHWCRYGTAGTTQANQSAALAVARPGDTVLVARNAHRSTLTGLVLAGVRPVWLPLDVDDASGLPLGVGAGTLRTALARHPDAAAVFLVEPTYVGTLSDRAALIAAAHGHGIPVVIDQAWGAHLGFHPDAPPHGIALGADVVTFSAHKTLPAYSQGSVILARHERLDRGRLDRGFDALNTTSPAGSILASVDAACAVLAGPRGGELLDALHRRVAGARRALLAGIEGVRIPGPDEVAPGRFDPAKLVLLLAGTGLDGAALEATLIAAGLPVEQADRDTVIPIVTMLDDDDTVGALVDALVAAAAGGERRAPRGAAQSWRLPQPQVGVDPREAFFAAHETVPATAALGRISAELIAPYPPGVPVLAPGEVITAEALDALGDARRRGVRIAYAADPTLATFTVVR